MRALHAHASCVSLVAAPTVTALEPDQLPTQGGTLVIRGANLGCDPTLLSAGLAFHELQFQSFEVLEPHSAVRCHVPPMPPSMTSGSAVEISLAVNGCYSKSTPLLTFSALATDPAYVGP
jgi:hypothetical protein